MSLFFVVVVVVFFFWGGGGGGGGGGYACKHGLAMVTCKEELGARIKVYVMR